MAYTNIDDPSAHFHTQLYTGNGTAIGSGGNVITNNANSGNFKPDWTWHKVRSTANDHQVYDSSRGVKIRLNPNATNSDFTLNEGLQSFDTNGFTVGSDGGVNSNNQTYVAWQWKANGGTTASNTDGSLTSTVQANTTAGFSIVGYTCPNPITNFTIGHGLGVTPDVIIVKTRDGSRNWGVYHKSLTSPAENRNLKLNLTNAEAAESSFWANTAPTSSVITIAQNASVNYQGHNYIAYCFAEKQGYSKFGSYVGNANTDGTFVYLGFKPAFIIFKNTQQTTNWAMYDVKRDSFNVATNELQPNTTAAANDDIPYSQIDILSNGIKMRNNNGLNTNAYNGQKFIYMAFAENPFVTSTGIPTTAR